MNDCVFRGHLCAHLPVEAAGQAFAPQAFCHPAAVLSVLSSNEEQRSDRDFCLREHGVAHSRMAKSLIRSRWNHHLVNHHRTLSARAALVRPMSFGRQKPSEWLLHHSTGATLNTIGCQESQSHCPASQPWAQPIVSCTDRYLRRFP